ncbi:hypothetical protein [Corynebacterium sp. H130]|uniref:hypothetical protein n=1 Tax=Corynebacterium sp. H130 TaxID=3133444 RepID=UPI0030A8D03E
MERCVVKVATTRWFTLSRTKALIALGACGLASCTIPTDTKPAERTTVVVETVTEAPTTTTIAHTKTLDISDILAQYGGTAGIALVDATGTHTAGPLQSDVAWSTIKVPIVLAATRQGSADPALVSSAIRASDNASAQVLWDSLGPQAGSLVATEIGKVAPAPKVVSQVTRPGFSAFGQTQWALTDQASFGFKLQCHDLASSVTPHMGAISNGGGYGLGTLDQAAFKGGWGPDVNGNYLARQFGFVQTPRGTVGVAIAAKAGSYGNDQAMLTALAARAQEFIQQQDLGTPAC